MKLTSCFSEFLINSSYLVRRNPAFTQIPPHKALVNNVRRPKTLKLLVLFTWFFILSALPFNRVMGVYRINENINIINSTSYEIYTEGSLINKVNILPPVAVCRNITVRLGSGGTITITGSDVDGGSYDPDGTIVSLNVAPNTFTCTEIGANTVTLTVTDNEGLTATCTATVTIEDKLPPVMACKDFTLYLDQTGTGTLAVSDLNNGSADNCPAGFFLYISKANFNCSDIGAVVPVTLIGTDASGNTASCISQVTVLDNISPKVNVKTFNLVLDSSGTGTLLPSDVDNGSFDNCGPATLSVSPNVFSCSDAGLQTVTLTALDSHGNSSSANVSITVSSTLEITGMSLNNCNIVVPYALYSATIEGGDGNYSYFWKGIDETSKPFLVIIPIWPYLQFYNTSTVATPFFNNTMPDGIYGIRLVITDGNGCTDTSEMVINKTGLIYNNITLIYSEACEGEIKTYSVVYEPDATYSWGVENGTILSADPDTSRIEVQWNTGIPLGVVTATIQKPNLIGDPCAFFVIDTVTLNPSPIPVLNNPVTNVCTNTEYTYSLTSTFNSYYWTVTGGYITGGGTIADNFVTVRWGNSPAGSVTASVQNTTSCTGSVSVNISISNLSGTITSLTDITCNGASDGTVTAAVSPGSGVSPFEYSLDGGLWQPGGIFTGISLGNHIVSIRDALLCTFDIPFVINQPTPLSGIISGQTDVSCFGGSDGSLTITASGGVLPYEYSLNGGPFQVSNIFNGLSAGSYIITVQDDNGCQSFIPVTITQPAAPLNGTTFVINVLCFGGTTGAVNLTVTGGTSPYSFLWNNGAVTEDLINIGAGTYSVVITDAKGCTANASATVTQPASALNGTTTVTNVLCFGGSTGAVNLTVSGGTPPYTFLWSNGSTTEDINGLAPGTYTVTITDANSCTFVASGTVTQPAAPLGGTTVVTNVSCFGGTNGAVNLTVTGGTGPYTFLWSNGSVTEDINGLTAGTYTVTITDANSCTTTATGVITQPALALSGTTVVTNVLCFGGTTGAVNLTVIGGTTPYTFLWSNGATTEDLTNITSGTYTVTITDVNSCTANAAGIVTQPATAVGGTISSQTNVLCFGGNNGSVTVSGSGGIAPYEYRLGAGAFQPSGTFTSLSAGTYSITVRDANLCTYTLPVTITQPAAALGGSVSSQTNVGCFGDATGSVTIIGTGGSVPYEFNIDGGAFQASGTFNTLTAGVHIVIIRDINLCTFNLPVTITQPAAALSGSIVSQTNVSCFGGTTGSVTVTGSGGTSPYEYSLDAGAYQLSGIFNNLGSGVHTVTVRDANICLYIFNVTITQPLAALSVTTTKVDVKCFGGSTGSAGAIPSGGTPPYGYSWNTIPVQTTAVATGLTAGTYTVMVTDNNGCITTASVTITQPPVPITATTSVSNILCYGASTGAIDLTVLNGTPPIVYLWSNGATTEDLVGVAAGTYTVTVTDVNNCTTTAGGTITQPAELIGSLNISNVACFGDSSAAIDLTVSGGTSPYTFIWSNGATTEDLTGLLPGSYSVTVTDANSCNTVVTGDVTQPFTALTGSITSQTNVTTYGGNDGSVTVDGSGGTSPYLYKLDAGVYQSSGTFSSLSAGTYTVTIQDNNFCIFDVIVTITQPWIPLTANITSQTDVLCFGGNTGSVTVTGWGGTLPYEYRINAGTYQPSGTFGSLTTGTYTITVRDAMMDTADISVTIMEPAALNILTAQIDVLCQGEATGTASAAVTGGTGPFSYSWNTLPVQTTATAISLPAGTYTVTVTDYNGCVATASVVIGQPADPLSVTMTQVNVLCSGGSAGSATATAAGGTAPYAYSWNTAPVQTTATASGLTAGGYTVTLTDFNGCTAAGSVQITEPQPLSLQATPVMASCPDASDGSITLTITGGLQPYNIIWDDLNLNQNRIDLLPGTYKVVVTDQNACAKSLIVEIDYTGTFNCIEIPQVITPNNDGYNDEWILRNIDLYPDAEVRIFNRWGKLIYHTKNISANPWDGRDDGKLVPTDSYHYILYLNDGSKPKTGVISVIR